MPRHIPLHNAIGCNASSPDRRRFPLTAHSEAKAFVSVPNLGLRPSVFLGNIWDFGANRDRPHKAVVRTKNLLSVTKTLLNVTTSVCAKHASRTTSKHGVHLVSWSEELYNGLRCTHTCSTLIPFPHSQRWNRRRTDSVATYTQHHL